MRWETALRADPRLAQLRQHLAAARAHGGVLSVHAPLPGVWHRSDSDAVQVSLHVDRAQAAAAVPVMPCETTAGPAEGPAEGMHRLCGCPGEAGAPPLSAGPGRGTPHVLGRRSSDAALARYLISSRGAAGPRAGLGLQWRALAGPPAALGAGVGADRAGGTSG